MMFKKTFIIAFLIANILQGFCFGISVYGQSNSSQKLTANDITFSGDAVDYLQSIGIKNIDDINPVNAKQTQMLKDVLYSIMTKNNTEDLNKTVAGKAEVADAVLALIQIQRAYSKFAISLDKSFFKSFPNKKTIKNLDANFKRENGGIIFNPEEQNFGIFGKNKICITDKNQSKNLSGAFSKLPVAYAPIGLMPDGNGRMNAVNMFGETVAVFDENRAANIGGATTKKGVFNFEKQKLQYRAQIETKFANIIGDNTPIFVSIDSGNCQPNALAEKIEFWSRCKTCKYFLQVNEIFFNVADAMYSFLSIHLLAILALVLGLRFLYTFGKLHYSNMGNVNYKEFFFNFTRIKILKIIIFLGLLWVPPSVIVKWAVEPVVLMGVTLSKEILVAGGAVKNKKMCNEEVLMKDMFEDSDQKKAEFLSKSNVLLPRTENMIDGNLFYDADGKVKNYKSEKKEIMSGYTASILCNVYEVRDYISKHLIVGQVLAGFAVKEMFKPTPNTTGGTLQTILSSPIFFLTIGLATAVSGLFGLFGIIGSITAPLANMWARTTMLINLFLFGGFVFVSMILFNFILFLYFLDLVINLAVVIMKIPVILIVWVFKDSDKIDLSFSDFFKDVKGSAIAIASISFIVVFMMTFMEYVYYGLLGIPVGAIDKAFELGRESLITQPIIDAMISGSSSLQFAFFDMLLIILTFWYISKNMGSLLNIVGGQLPASGFVESNKKFVKGLYDKIMTKDMKKKLTDKAYDGIRNKVKKK